MRIIRLKNGWNVKDTRLVLNDRITEMRLTTYWSAIDDSFKFNATRREIFFAKNLQENSQKKDKTSSNKETPTGRAQSSPQPLEDPMKAFFRRHNADYNEECCRGAREDTEF